MSTLRKTTERRSRAWDKISGLKTCSRISESMGFECISSVSVLSTDLSSIFFLCPFEMDKGPIKGGHLSTRITAGIKMENQPLKDDLISQKDKN